MWSHEEALTDRRPAPPHYPHTGLCPCVRSSTGEKATRPNLLRISLLTLSPREENKRESYSSRVKLQLFRLCSDGFVFRRPRCERDEQHVTSPQFSILTAPPGGCRETHQSLGGDFPHRADATLGNIAGFFFFWISFLFSVEVSRSVWRRAKGGFPDPAAFTHCHPGKSPPARPLPGEILAPLMISFRSLF